MIRTLYFHANNGIALTLVSEAIENGHYIVSMALTHKQDRGSKKFGFEMAYGRMFRYSATGTFPEFVAEYDIIPPGQQGLYVVENLETLKKIVAYLRDVEKFDGNSRKRYVYNAVFFDLYNFYEKKIEPWWEDLL